MHVGFHANIKIDGQLKRAIFADRTNQYGINATATLQQQCRELEASVTFSLPDIFKPIDIEMSYVVTNQLPQNDTGKYFGFSFSLVCGIFCIDFLLSALNFVSEFCDTCVAVNPTDVKVAGNKVVFSSGCASAKCVADLKLSSRLADVQK